MTAVVVKLTWGAERPEALLQALTVATTALASGKDVSLWLTGEAVTLALPGGDDVTLPHSASAHDLRDAILDAGVITVCTQCALRRGIGQEDLLPGVRIAGAAAFLEEATAADATALVY